MNFTGLDVVGKAGDEQRVDPRSIPLGVVVVRIVRWYRGSSQCRKLKRGRERLVNFFKFNPNFKYFSNYRGLYSSGQLISPPKGW